MNITVHDILTIKSLDFVLLINVSIYTFIFPILSEIKELEEYKHKENVMILSEVKQMLLMMKIIFSELLT